MKILAITDIHGRQNINKELTELIIDSDVVIIAGDITDFGGEKDADKILKELLVLNENILAVPGNCDTPGVNKTLTNLGINLHGTMKKINDVAIYGLGGSNESPFNTPQEYRDSEIETILKQFKKDKSARFHIIVSHPPPVKTKVDKVFLGHHVGSKAVRGIIERFQPDLVICGHIHEARGVDRIGKTVVINPGPFPKHCAIISLSKGINYELR